MFECIHCGEKALIWMCDFSFEDYGRDGEGIVSTYHCSKCGADIECYINLDDDKEQ